MPRTAFALVAAVSLALAAAACESTSSPPGSNTSSSSSSASQSSSAAPKTNGQLVATGAVSGTITLSRVTCSAGNGGAFITWSGELGSAQVVGEIQTTGTGSLTLSASGGNRVTFTNGPSSTSGTVYTTSASGGAGTLTISSNNSGSMTATLVNSSSGGGTMNLSGSWTCS